MDVLAGGLPGGVLQPGRPPAKTSRALFLFQSIRGGKKRVPHSSMYSTRNAPGALRILIDMLFLVAERSRLDLCFVGS